jgi:hypothetical protein
VHVFKTFFQKMIEFSEEDFTVAHLRRHVSAFEHTLHFMENDRHRQRFYCSLRVEVRLGPALASDENLNFVELVKYDEVLPAYTPRY